FRLSPVSLAFILNLTLTLTIAAGYYSRAAQRMTGRNNMSTIVIVDDQAVNRNIYAKIASSIADDVLRADREQAEIFARAARPLSILVAEGNRTNQKVIVKTLERVGHSATVVNDGGAALDALEENHFDLVLMDLNMPVMNGIEATKLYRFSSIGQPHVPIVALTADATTDAWARCKEAGMDGCVTKPIEPARLLDVIDSVLSRPEVIQVQNVEDTTVSMADRIAASKIESLIE